jgi:Aspartokinases
MGAASKPVYFERERGVSRVDVTPGVAHVSVRFADAARAQSERLSLLQALAAASVPVFMVKLGPDSLCFAIRAEAVDAGEAVLKERGHDYTMWRDLALLSIMAGAMRDLSGVMAGIYEALVGQGIPVRQTGDAYNAVHCLVEGAVAERGAAALRERFQIIEEEAAP